jgi:hypothetical protein
MQTTHVQLVQPSLVIEDCIDADTCSRELKRCADEADRCAALAQGTADIAIRHAWNAGTVCLKAKEILPHGEFQSWLEANAGERGYRTLAKWMKLAKVNLDALLTDSPQLKGLQDAYVAAGVLPMPEEKEKEQGEEQEKPPYTLTFKTKYRHVTEWNKEAARDFLYEFDRLGLEGLAQQLKEEFGI